MCSMYLFVLTSWQRFMLTLPAFRLGAAAYSFHAVAVQASTGACSETGAFCCSVSAAIGPHTGLSNAPVLAVMLSVCARCCLLAPPTQSAGSLMLPALTDRFLQSAEPFCQTSLGHIQAAFLRLLRIRDGGLEVKKTQLHPAQRASDHASRKQSCTLQLQVRTCSTLASGLLPA